MKFLGLLASSVASLIFKGWVVSTLWLWFVVTTFNLPELGIPTAIGIIMCTALLTKSPSLKSPQEEDHTLSTISSYLFPLVGLLIGWIAHSFI